MTEYTTDPFKTNHPSAQGSKLTIVPDEETIAQSKKLIEALNRELTKTELFENALGETFAEAHLLLLKKHRDYGPKNIALAPGGALNGLRVRMHDKLARINHLVDNGAEPENESLRDSFLDLLNYSAIALMVIDGNWYGVEHD